MVRSSDAARFLVVDHVPPFDLVECSVEVSIGNVRLSMASTVATKILMRHASDGLPRGRYSSTFKSGK
jgi:hypothetical protein